MAVNNPDFEHIWLEIESQLLKASEEIQSEVRCDVETQISEVITDTQQKTPWIQRLHVGSQVQLNVADEWFVGNVQHACEKALVLLTGTSITVVNSDKVMILREIETKISLRGHSELRCWNSVLLQVHDIKVNQNGHILVGSVQTVNLDAFDLQTPTDRFTIPWKQVSFVQISL